LKPVGSLVTLTLARADDEVQAGDDLVTSTGRRYRVLEREKKRLTCLVVPSDDAPTTGTERTWTWAWRGRKHG
jgi:hypothetical protein